MSRRLLTALLAVLCLISSAAPVAALSGPDKPKVAVIVGPVGNQLTTSYLGWAEETAAAAEARGAVVTRAFSPDATPEAVLAAVKNANVVIYYGHGFSYPNPYGRSPEDSKTMNGWALNGPKLTGDHSDDNGAMTYYDADWIIEHAEPAPGFVMVYAHTCYAPGAPDAGPASTPAEARERASRFAAPVFALGASAYYAIDFGGGATRIVDGLLAEPETSYYDRFAAERSFFPAGVMQTPGGDTEGRLPDWATLYQQRSTMHIDVVAENQEPRWVTDYFYAFAGDPDASPVETWSNVYDTAAPSLATVRPAADSVHAAVDAPLTFRFDEPVTDVADGFATLTDADGAAVAGSLSYDPETYTATFVPTEELVGDAAYQVVLAAGEVRDLFGNPFPGATLHFSTDATAPEFVASYPGDRASGFPLDGTITISFNEPMSVPNAAATLLVDSSTGRAVPTAVELGADARTLQLRPNDGLVPNRAYELRLGPAVRDSAGNGLSERSAIVFQAAGADEAMSFEPMEIRVPAGQTKLLQPNQAEEAYKLTSVEFAAATTIRVDQRAAHAGQPGHWLHIVDGEYADTWIGESPSMFVPGLAAVTEFANGGEAAQPTRVSLTAGTHEAVLQFNPDGTPVEYFPGKLEQGSATDVVERMTLNGQSWLLVSGGIFDQLYIREGPRAQLRLAQMPAPVATVAPEIATTPPAGPALPPVGADLAPAPAAPAAPAAPTVPVPAVPGEAAQPIPAPAPITPTTTTGDADRRVEASISVEAEDAEQQASQADDETLNVEPKGERGERAERAVTTVSLAEYRARRDAPRAIHYPRHLEPSVDRTWLATTHPATADDTGTTPR